jgi:hypothetical protein
MQEKNKRIARILLLLAVIAGGTVLALKYLPFSFMHRKQSTPEEQFVNREKIRNTAPNSLFFDFEVDPKTGSQKDLYKGIAHSGQFSTKTFGKNSYSLVIERKAGDVGPGNLAVISLSAWIYVFPGNNDLESSLVFAASNEGVNLTWQGVTLRGHDFLRGKWFKISGSFNLQEIAFTPGSKLQFYFWNNSANDILMDDLSVVFGKPLERPGDSARFDMTRGLPFVPKFNSPPYPFQYFTKEEIGNEDSRFLVKKEKLAEGDIHPSDAVITGHFASPATGTDDILVIGKGGKPDLFVFTKEDHSFRKVEAVFPSGVMNDALHRTILKGTFTQRSCDQLLLAGENEVTLLTPSGNKLQQSRLEWEVDKVILKGIKKGKGASLVAADLNGDGLTELLLIRPGGTWNLFSFSGNRGHLNVSGISGKAAVEEWKTVTMETKITAGRFLPHFNQEQLLTVSRDMPGKTCSYSIMRFDAASRTFIPCRSGKHQQAWKTIGPDTLKPGDEFLSGNFDNGGNVSLLRYNRDWRYDLKEIGFNDSAFRIMANIDFKGFEKDHNPKYFESLRIFAGKFTDPHVTSLLLIQRNSVNADTKQLPDAIQIYSFTRQEK